MPKQQMIPHDRITIMKGPTVVMPNKSLTWTNCFNCEELIWWLSRSMTLSENSITIWQTRGFCGYYRQTLCIIYCLYIWLRLCLTARLTCIFSQRGLAMLMTSWPASFDPSFLVMTQIVHGATNEFTHTAEYYEFLGTHKMNLLLKCHL